MDMSATTGPLDGFAIGVTADRRAAEQMTLFESLGAESLHGPTVQMRLVQPQTELLAASERLVESPPDVLVVSSGIGIRGWLDAADAFGSGPELRAALAQTTILVQDANTHGATIAAGLDVGWHGASGTIDELVDHISSLRYPAERITVLLDGAARHPILDQLCDLGADLTTITAYRCALPGDLSSAETLVRAAVERKVDAVTFVSSSAAEHYVHIAERVGLFEELQLAFQTGLIAGCLDEGAVAGLDRVGASRVLRPSNTSLGSLVQAVATELVAQTFEVSIGGSMVKVQGRRIAVNGDVPVHLSVRERQLLGALVNRPGVVRSKQQLLDEVWLARESNPHLVEVTVGRLRRRLGTAGAGIQTIVKRGYRASPD